MGEHIDQAPQTTTSGQSGGQEAGVAGSSSAANVKARLRGQSYDEQVKMLTPAPASGRERVLPKEPAECEALYVYGSGEGQAGARLPAPPEEQEAKEAEIESNLPTHRAPLPDEIAPTQQWMKNSGQPWDSLRALEKRLSGYRRDLATPGNEGLHAKPEKDTCLLPPDANTKKRKKKEKKTQKENSQKEKFTKAELLKDNAAYRGLIVKWREEDLIITDKHLNQERNAEAKFGGANGYPDAGARDNSAYARCEDFISAVIAQFPELDLGKHKGAVPSYRSYAKQIGLFDGKVTSQGGVSARQQNSALPGFSQHHTGRAFDIFSTENSWWNARPQVKRWVIENACRFGFIVSYPVATAGRTEEPWHIFAG